MSIIQRSFPNRNQVVAGTTGAVLAELARFASPIIKSYMSSGQNAGNSQFPREYYRDRGSIGPSNYRISPGPSTSRPSKNRRSRRRKKNGLPRSPIDSTTVHITVHDVIDFSNISASGSSKGYFSLGVNHEAGFDMRTWIPRATVLSVAFRYFRVKSLKVSYLPTCSSETSGYVAIGVDPEPKGAIPGDVKNVIRHVPSVVGDIKDKHTFMWRPSGTEQDSDKVTAGFIAGQPDTLYNQGCIQFFSSNGLASGAVFGLLEFELTIGYSQPV